LHRAHDVCAGWGEGDDIATIHAQRRIVAARKLRRVESHDRYELRLAEGAELVFNARRERVVAVFFDDLLILAAQDVVEFIADARLGGASVVELPPQYRSGGVTC
jgi:hypothetical protein